MIGQTISHYKVVSKLGEGGMGVVYKAQDLKLDRFVALKFFPVNLHPGGKEQARFLQEARAAATLNHPNICVIHAIEEVDGQQFIVMEYVDGRTLRDVARGHPGSEPHDINDFEPPRTMQETRRMSIDEATSYAMQICEALHEAHSKGIVHRDIKSENIMVNSKNQIKVMDFGLAKLKGSMRLTKSFSTVGTLAYMAPEQIQRGDVDPRTDLWAFGVVLFEMLTGRLPFEGEHKAAVMYEILSVDAKAIQGLRPDVPEPLQKLITQLLQKNPDNRVSTAAEVIERLKEKSVPASVAPMEKSIAVLYFENMSSEKDSEYFCAGMTEDIITDLSKIKDLKVVSRTDVLPFRNKEVNTRQVGHGLHVNYILEGSVRKAGNKIRITAQLIDVHTGFHVWAERFDRLLEDIFDIQNEVSQRIAEALKVSVTDSEKHSLAEKPTDDLRAYDFYMRGTELLSRRGRKNNELAIQMFESALVIDPDFSSAYARLAEAYSYMYEWFDGDPAWLGRAIEMNQKALSIDPESTEAQFGIAMVYFHQKRLAEARRVLEKIVEQKSDFYDAHLRLGMLSEVAGDIDAALRHYERSAEIKPYNEEAWMYLDGAWRRKGDAQSSDRAARKLIEVASRKLEVTPDDIITLSRLAVSYARYGGKEEAHFALKRVLEIDPNDGLALYSCACTYAMLGESQEALACLRNAIANGWKGVPELARSNPDLDSLRKDPEFGVVLAESHRRSYSS